MKLIYLGGNQRHIKHDNVYHYLFNNDKCSGEDCIMESDYLTQPQLNTANSHLAEFSAFYVFWKNNPLSLKDEDIICLVSSRKFNTLTGFNHLDILNFESLISKLITGTNDFYSFLHGDIKSLENPDGSISKKCDYDNTLNNPNGLFNFPEIKPYIKDVRHIYSNYAPAPGRHYFCYTYKTFKSFFSWVYERLFKTFFNEDLSEKLDENGVSIIIKIQPTTKSYTPHRSFGLIVEHFHHKFFLDENSSTYWHPFGDKNPSFVYKQDFINDDLDWTAIKKML